MRILFVSSYTGLGGGETILLSLMTALRGRNVEPILLAPREGQLPEAARDAGIPVHIEPYRGAPTAFVPWLWARLPAARRIRAAIDRIGPDVVHSDYHSLPFVAAACRDRIPVIFMCWGWWYRPRRWQRSFFASAPAITLAASGAVLEGFVGSPPRVPTDRIRLVYPGVDTERFAPRPSARLADRQHFGLEADGQIVAMVGRFQDVKGHDTFLEAVRLAAPRSRSTRFVVAGESVFGDGGERAFKQRVLKMHADDPLLRERVTFLGWVPDPERLVNACDLLVCPSRFETFGMALVEAMSCGTPVVSTNVGGPSETIVDGETGRLVRPDDPQALADAMLDLLADDDRRLRMGEAARTRVLAHFSLERYAADVSRIADEVVRGRAMSTGPRA